MTGPRIAILHAGPNRSYFGELPGYLARATGLPIVADDQDLDLAYVLAWYPDRPPRCRTFIPFASLLVCEDKRLQAEVFARAGVSTPEWHLLDGEAQLHQFRRARRDRTWALKWPVGCGAVGHRIVSAETRITRLWPTPLLVQEFIALREPAVYRLYAAAGKLFGWNVRRFPPGRTASPWVAAVAGAISIPLGEPPPEAASEVAKALEATGLLGSFGCVDLLLAPDGRWLVLEVNTDGLSSYVLRTACGPALEAEIGARINDAVARASREIDGARTNPSSNPEEPCRPHAI
jgi:hypothetical protein